MRVGTEIERSAEMACRGLETIVHQSATLAQERWAARRRDYVLWGAAYLGASLLGGAIVALALRIP